MNDPHASIMKCEELKEVLFDYMTRELGGSRSDLVRKHLRKCPDCSHTASEIEETLTLLQNDSKQVSHIPETLSDEHRKRVIRSITHPILDWMYRYHRLVSTITAIVVIAAVYFLVTRISSRITESPESGPPVMIRHDDPESPGAVRDRP